MKMNIKRIITAISILLAFTLLMSCQDVADEIVGKKPDGAKTLEIIMIPKSGNNPVFQSAKIGAEAAAKELSEKYSMLDVKVSWLAPESDNPSEQVEVLHSALKYGPDVILVSCTDEDSLTEAINSAVSLGIPVMTFDSDASESKRFSFYGPDDVEMGENILKELADQIGGSGQIAILGGNQGAPNLQKRVEGIKKAAADYPDIEIVGEFYHLENEEDAINEMLRVNELYPDLKGWAMVGGWPLFGKKLFDKVEPGKIKIVGMDALPIQLEYIEKGYVQALFGQPTFKWGKIPVETIVDKFHLEKEIEESILMKPIKVNIENLGGWSRQLRAWGYEGLPEKYLIM
jgi:ribose transport system substrate-binding protein